MTPVIIYTFAYLFPSFLLFYLAVTILVRNIKRTEHVLLAVYMFLYLGLFMGEFVRHLSPMENSPAIVAYWFGNFGILIPGVFIHFFAKFSGFYKKMPRFLYPWIFYIGVIPIILTFTTQSNVINSQEFNQVGYWIYPVFNANYLITMSVASFFGALVAIALYFSWRKQKQPEKKRIYFTLFIFSVICIIWVVVFGFIQLRGILPPYSYIYSGIIWVVAMVYAISKMEFLETYGTRFKTLYEMNPLAILVVDERGKISSANPAATNLLQLENNRVLHEYIAEKRRMEWDEVFATMYTTLTNLKNYETKLVNRQGEERYVLVDSDFVRIDLLPHALIIIQDVDERYEAEKTIRFLAYHDPLTQLPNRRAFYERMEKQLQTAEHVAIFIIDLDGFKSVNDTYGHHIGDEFLKHVAWILTSVFNGDSEAARVGGDEFYAWQTFQTFDEVEERGLGVLRAMKEHPFNEDAMLIDVKASVGISSTLMGNRKTEQLIYEADVAMYDIKKKDKNSYKVYTPKRPVNSK
ncbi:diguanylate cyclase [Paenalkalicoccus suaedae]|uniref:Diguanylate cyclase n=1 Tax=Paenalkalicoccus suaedae TaxID=2592382 RepID=A0A859FEJ9_9BACI|nr:sensor domain-containing diguanylate cyclase [Paenalkalicoccus suaedae]QKS71599.1 diguanylate cyclase [Paenalkalicoccus suaedae]